MMRPPKAQPPRKRSGYKDRLEEKCWKAGRPLYVFLYIKAVKRPADGVSANRDWPDASISQAHRDSRRHKDSESCDMRL